MTGLNRVLLVLLAGGAGLGGGLLAQALRPESPVPRPEAGARTRAGGESRPNPDTELIDREPRGTASIDTVARQRIDALRRHLDGRLAGFEQRLAALPAAPGRRPDERAAGSAEPRRDPAQRSDGRGPVVSLVEELAGGSAVYTHERSQRLFGHLARRRSEIGPAIASLKEAIASDPKNPHLHAALGTALSAKTAYATAPGPEQGTVWKEAEKAFQTAIELDPAHWEARYSLAFGDSMAPEFVGMRPRAIRRFEELVEIQERQAPEKDHVLAYVRLGTLYKDAGNTKKAREIWQRGRRRHPRSEELADVLKLIGTEADDG